MLTKMVNIIPAKHQHVSSKSCCSKYSLYSCSCIIYHIRPPDIIFCNCLYCSTSAILQYLCVYFLFCCFQNHWSQPLRSWSLETPLSQLQTLLSSGRRYQTLRWREKHVLVEVLSLLPQRFIIPSLVHSASRMYALCRNLFVCMYMCSVQMFLWFG